MIISERNTFFDKSKEIADQIQKVGDLIVGVRFFNFLEPSFRSFHFNNDKYLIRKFPKVKTYSMNVSARTREGHVFRWK